MELPAATAVVLVVVAAAFLPIANLPSFDVVKLAVLVPCVAIATFAAARRRAEAHRETALLDPLLLVPAVVALAAAVAALTAWPRGSLTGPALFLAAVAAARLVPPGTDGVRSTLRAASLAAAATGLYAVAQKAGLDPAPWGWRREVVATFGNTSFAAEFQAAALPMAIVLAVRAESRRDRALGWAGALLAATHLALARSRIDLVAAAAACGVLAVIVLPDRRAARRLATGGVVAAAGVAALFVGNATGALAWLGRSDTLHVRLHIWESTLRLVADAPLRFGAAPFVDLFPPFRNPEEYRISMGRVVDTPHADLLEVAATLGVAGLAAAIAWLVVAVRRVNALRRDAPWEAGALGAALAALFVSGLASSPLTHPATALLAALAVGHVVALAPRPVSAGRWSARAADVAMLAALIAAFWPGPALPSLRSATLVAAGITRRSAADLDSAALAFDTACRADAQSFQARYELGTLLWRRDEPEAAVQALESARAIRRNDLEGRTNLVLALRDAGRAADADRLLEESLGLCPWHPLLLTARAARASAAGDFAAAVPDLARAASLLPHDLRIRAVLAEAQLGAAPDETARTAALDLLAEIHAAGDVRLLMTASRAYSQRDPLFLAVLATRAERIAAAQPDLAAALVLAPVGESGLTPDDPGYFIAAARVLRTAGREAAARRMTGRGRGVRARQALAAGDADLARRLALEAAELDPVADHRVTEALALARAGDRPAVREALSAALALGPVDEKLLREDPAFAALLPDPGIEDLLARRPAR